MFDAETTGVPEWRETVEALDAIDGADPGAGDEAFRILVSAHRPQIVAAYCRVLVRTIKASGVHA